MSTGSLDYPRLLSRFYDNVDLVNISSEGCWLWVGPTDNNGYGIFSVAGRNRRAHRMQYEFCDGPIPPSLSILHACGNRRCVYYKHLRAGTAKANAIDRELHGRTARGQRHGRAKLTDAAVRSARALWAQGQSIYRLARNLQLSYAAMRFAVLGRTWKHVV
jgi:hypothetical protein